MRKLADHHPARRIMLGRSIRGCTQSRGRSSQRGTPGKREMRTLVQEFWLTDPATGYARLPVNFRSEAATQAIWCTHSKRGAYRRDHYVEGKAKPLRPRVVKRYK